MKLRGKFYTRKHDNGSLYWVVKINDEKFKFNGSAEIELSPEHQEERKKYLKETMSLEGEEVDVNIVKKFLAGVTKYYSELIYPEPTYTIQDIIDAVAYGFNYHNESQHSGYVPVGNTLQWLLAKKKMLNAPKNYEKYNINSYINISCFIILDILFSV